MMTFNRVELFIICSACVVVSLIITHTLITRYKIRNKIFDNRLLTKIFMKMVVNGNIRNSEYNYLVHCTDGSSMIIASFYPNDTITREIFFYVKNGSITYGDASIVREECHYKPIKTSLASVNHVIMIMTMIMSEGIKRNLSSMDNFKLQFIEK